MGLLHLDRIADALERIANAKEGKEPPTKLEEVSSKDFSLITRNDDEILEAEDLEVEAAINERLETVEREGSSSFFLEDDIRDITGGINEH